MERSSFVPCSWTTGAPELQPIGAIIEIPEKQLRIYHIDQEQIRMLEEFYGLRNGWRPKMEYLRPALTAKRRPARKNRR